MPRRPRPSSRKAPQRAAPAQQAVSSSSHVIGVGKIASRTTRQQPQAQESPSHSEASSSVSEGDALSGDESSDAYSSDLNDEDADAGAEPDVPRVAQWIDEEELEAISGEGSSLEDSEEDIDDGARLEEDLHSLSFGTLRKAQKALSRAHATSGSEDKDGLSDLDSAPEEDTPAPRPALDKGKQREELKPTKKDIPKRKHKHAPTEMSSKRPVSRSRFVVEEKPVPRDPRFLPMAGEFDTKRFHSQYGFLSEMHQEELKALRENLKRARKLLANSPRDLREEREAEVVRLERTVKRAESSVNKDRREKVELEALSKVAKEERDKRKQGKGAWYMKDADKKAFLLRAKYDALAEAGGKGAVRKAIEKKQKKVSQKEKKKRPYPAGQTSASRGGFAVQGGPKRHHGEQAGGARKRPRFA